MRRLSLWLCRGKPKRSLASRRISPVTEQSAAEPGQRRADPPAVYTHNARLAERFRIDRVLLAAMRRTLCRSGRVRDTTAACGCFQPGMETGAGD